MKKIKKIIIISILVLVVAAISIVTLTILKKKNREKKTADVFAMSDVGSPGEYVNENKNIVGGMVYSEAVQRVYLTSTDMISKVNVKVGDTVKAGDILLEYDMTVQQLAIDSKKASVEIARTNILAAERQLKELQNIVPVEKKTEEQPTEEPAEEPTGQPEAPLASDTDASINMASETQVESPENNALEPDETTYTKEELDEAISNKNKEIKALKIEYQRQQIELEMLIYNQNNGGIVANFDGVILEVNDQEEAILNNQPYITLSGESGYTIKCNLEENAVGKVKCGDTVSMYSYETGMYYTGTIKEISDIPSDEYGEDEMYTYYPVTIISDDNEDMSQNMYLEITFDDNASKYDGSVCIPLAFVKKEHGNYFVYKEVDGKLKKVYVKAGKIVWGDSIIIKSGVTLDDYLAIPYSKNAEEGVKTVHKETQYLWQ